MFCILLIRIVLHCKILISRNLLMPDVLLVIQVYCIFFGEGVFVPVFTRFVNKSVTIAIRYKDGYYTINYRGATSYLSFFRLSWNFYRKPDKLLPESTVSIENQNSEFLLFSRFLFRVRIAYNGIVSCAFEYPFLCVVMVR
jgi:hypothetical protein